MENIIKIESDIDNYLNSIVNNCETYKIKEKIINLLEMNKPRELQKYSSRIIALIVEKKIVLATEKNLLKYNKSCWNMIKNNVSNFTENKEILHDFVDLFILSINDSNEKDNHTISDIKKYYEDSLKKILSDIIVLPSGFMIDFKKMIINSEEYLKNSQFLYNIKKGIVISSTVSLIAIYPKLDISIEQANSYEKIYLSNESIAKEEKLIIENKKINIKEKPQSFYYEKEFVGYENSLNVDLQKYMYEISQKYNIPFEVLMTVSHIESDGKFDTNGVISSTNDYGFMQINECNIDYIYNSLGFDKTDILNDPYKNIEASAFLISKIYFIDEETNVEDIFGMYNGWINWEKKKTSQEYVKKSLEVYQNYANEEVFVSTKQIR